ncbi:unnamed protein product [Kuraishia capsulata CBS 1993]|uniref:Uncharacterized protein n=1 Tax=Kuraishia capsulata CBS 1993 TaxID=1382522 RepID=W6MRU1_9ASCO|nr:uncharacterized protein KUCA_T00000495001 [Kuraishia capsulata CBS 1993]CDK24530.1 unnamed protein product [Kuraishia capsulata CBS 1993]
MFRILAQNSVKQGQRASSKALQHNHTTQPARLFNTSTSANALQEAAPEYYKKPYHGGNPGFNKPQRKYDSRRRVNRFQNNYIPAIPEDSPFKAELQAFEECIAHNASYDLASGALVGGSSEFWNAVYAVMPLYKSLVAKGGLDKYRSAQLVALLRNGLRVYRMEVSHFDKNFDFDSDTPIRNIHDFLMSSIREVTNDLLDGKFMLTSSGLCHLFKAYKDLGLIEEASYVWKTGKSTPHLSGLFAAETVLGAVFPFLIESGDFDFDELLQMYNEIRNSKKEDQHIHNELQVGMIRACLVKGYNDSAVAILRELSTSIYNDAQLRGQTPPTSSISYITVGHLSFIGFCKNLSTADMFFESAIKNEMPYPTPLQLNFVRKYLSNVWEVSKDYARVRAIWLRTWQNYEEKNVSNSSISSSLNAAFLSIFFEKYSAFSPEAFAELKKLIVDYNSVRPVDEPFLNILMSKSGQWGSLDVLNVIEEAFEHFNVRKTNVSMRCYLKNCGHVDVPNVMILRCWRELIAWNETHKYSFIAHADWTALRDATVNSPLVSKKVNGSQRADLYFKLWKLYSPYFNRLENFKTYVDKDVSLNPNYMRIFQNMKDVDTSDIPAPMLYSIKRNPAIERYIGYTY